ncbi:hypothetical protein D2V08_15685 [Flagellimonas lutimaris]|uniref:O-antigen ligase-related domain-containing protein n=1 Tax=Flagellimonas lutimaris TaxID=475082 RepID=A0A3A1N6J7_9FLAO|nr:O-antigen ligase family protein [Allomuricauda lutimaris]RIV30530.1 hypothetical protein D2V08_15685 [Allomuricauda lutimaris]
MNDSLLKTIKLIGIIPFTLIILYLLNPYDKGFVIGYLLFVFAYFGKGFSFKTLDKTYFILLIFSLVYASFYFLDMNQGNQWLIIYATSPHTFYLLGKRMVPKKMDSKVLAQILIFIGIIYSVTAILSVGFNIIEGGFVQVGRTIGDFWSGRERLATAMGAYFVFNMSIPGLLIVSKKNLSLWSKLLLIIIFIISLLCIFRLGSRTQIVLAIIGVFVGITYRLKSQNAISNLKFIAVLAILIFLGVNYISIDLDAEYLSSLGRRLQESDNAGSAGGRTELWSKSIENLFKKPFGWSINEFGYSHNMWLDTARTGTVISMFLITIFTFFSLKNIIKALKVNKDAFFLNATILIFNIIIFLQFFVEPVFDSPLFQLFIFFCLTQGFINEYRNKQVMEYTSD